MDKFYTSRYKEIREIIGLSIDIEGRWICSINKDNIGKTGVEYTLFDNFSECYRLRVDEENGITIDKGEIRGNSIKLNPKLLILLPLPNFAIDVLQTISHPVGLETLHRVAQAFKSKYNDR